MPDIIPSTYIKAVDDLALKLCVPGLICSIFVEIGPAFAEKNDVGLFWTYMFSLVTASVLVPILVYVYIEISVRVSDNINVAALIGVAIMPLGFAGFFPEYFEPYNIPYSKVTGLAILAWSLLLVKSLGSEENV